MLRHSYKVLLKKHEAQLFGLRLDFLKTKDETVLNKIATKEKEVEWFRQRIAEGKDTGVMIL